jgi:hypothetical protein
MLNPHALDYALQLSELLEQTGDNGPLRDNVLLAKTKLIADEQLRAAKLSQLHDEFKGKDGGIEALYELALLKKNFWHQQSESNLEQKKKSLAETRAILKRFLDLYPESIFADQAKKLLSNLPTD